MQHRRHPPVLFPGVAARRDVIAEQVEDEHFALADGIAFEVLVYALAADELGFRTVGLADCVAEAF